MFDSKNKIVINCAGDKALATIVFHFLLSHLKTISSEVEDFMTLTVDEVDIVDHENKVTSDIVEKKLSELLKSDTKKFDEYNITRLENVLTIGKKTDLLREMKICEFCGYMSKNYDDMYHHRLRCAFVARLGI